MTVATKPGFDRRHDGIAWKPVATVDRWTPAQVAIAKSQHGLVAPSGDDLAKLFEPDSLTIEGNLLTTAGLGRITSLITGAGGQAVTNTSARIGVGDTSTATAVGNTDLSATAGSTHRFFQPMDATYPTTSAGVMTFKSTFGTADGNFVWAEWGIDIGTPTVTGGTTVNAVLLNHAVAALGTKASGAVWALTVTIILS